MGLYMSQGVIKFNEDDRERYLARGAIFDAPPRLLPENIFEDAEYPCLVEGNPEINTLVAEFLRKIQNASFVPMRAIRDEDIPDQKGGYFSTLSPGVLAREIRENIGQLILSGIFLSRKDSRHASEEHSEALVDSSVQHPEAINGSFVHSSGSTVHVGGFDENVMECFSLFPDNIRELIENHGSGFAKGFEDMMRRFALSILIRSELSESSFFSDIMYFDIHEKYRNASYSTLNPEDFIPLARGTSESVAHAIDWALAKSYRESRV